MQGEGDQLDLEGEREVLMGGREKRERIVDNEKYCKARCRQQALQRISVRRTGLLLV